jgi:hypothetical protein
LQRFIFNAIFKYDRVACKACHASGKSFVAAAIVMTYVHLKIPCVVITTAPTLRQVRTILWKEIHRIFRNSRRALGGTMLQEMYSLFDDTFAIGLTTDDPDKFQGFHSENILVIADESPGIDEGVFEAIEGVMAGGQAKLLLLGNPSSLEGTFYRAFNHPAYMKLFKKYTISAFDTPNVKQKRDVIPGLITHKWVEERKRIWGPDHPLYQIKVLGEFPSREFGDLVVPPNFLDLAQNTKLPIILDDPIIYGVDVGAWGGDETAVAKRRSAKLVKVIAWNDADTPVSQHRIMKMVNEDLDRGNNVEIRIDSIGVGRGLYDGLKAIASERREGPSFKVIGIDVREKPVKTERYQYMRDEMWWEFREGLRHQDIDLSEFAKEYDADITFAQLTTPKYTIMPNTGLIKVESKPDLRKRNVQSPDRADAVVQAFYDIHKSKEPVLEAGSQAQLRQLEKESKWEGLDCVGGDRPWHGE